MKTISFDYIVIGSGLAGLTTSYHLSKQGTVGLITKTKLSESNSFHAQGGIAAVMDEKDSPQNHIEDTLIAGRELCEEDAVSVLVNSGMEAVREFIDMGMEFDKNDQDIVLGLEGGHSHRRILHAGGDATGRKMTEFILKKVMQIPNIIPLEETIAVDLILNSEKECVGVHTFNLNNQQNIDIRAKATFLASGGVSYIYSRSTNPSTATGDGLALAYQAGATLQDMEFIQFHPSALAVAGHKSFLISEAVRGEGAHLLDKDGVRFMPQKHPDAELAPRDIVAYSIHKQIEKTGGSCVYLSLDHLDRTKIRSRFQTIVGELDSINLDLATDLVPVAPAAHYTVGGIKTSFDGETGVSRLFACGEVASTGVMGANRLASNSLLECLVFSKRATELAIKNNYKLDTNSLPISEITLDLSLKESVSYDMKEISLLMNQNVGIVRNKAYLTEAIEILNSYKKKYYNKNTNDFSVKNILNSIETCIIIAQCALLREESRGGHIREDFKEPKDHYICHSQITRGDIIKHKKINKTQ